MNHGDFGRRRSQNGRFRFGNQAKPRVSSPWKLKIKMPAICEAGQGGPTGSARNTRAEYFEVLIVYLKCHAPPRGQLHALVGPISFVSEFILPLAMVGTLIGTALRRPWEAKSAACKAAK